MKNYFKIFRMRTFATDDPQRPDERYVFFEDSDPREVQRAADVGMGHKIALEKKHSKVRVALWRPVIGVRCHEIGDFVPLPGMPS